MCRIYRALFFYLDFGLRPRTRVVALQVQTRWPVHTSGSSRCNSEKSPPAKIHAHMPAATQKRVQYKSSSVKTETCGKLEQRPWRFGAVLLIPYCGKIISMNIPVQQYERSSAILDLFSTKNAGSRPSANTDSHGCLAYFLRGIFLRFGFE